MRVRLRQTATLRFVLLQVSLTMLSATLVYAVLAWRTERVIDEASRYHVDEIIALVVARTGQGGLPAAAQEVAAVIGGSRAERLVVRLEGPGGARLAGNLSAWPRGLGVDAGWRTLAIGRPGTPQARRYILRARSLAGGRLLVGREGEERAAFLDTLYESFALGLLLMLLAGLASGYVHARYTLEHLRAIARSARSIMAGDRTGRIADHGTGDEFDRLTGVLNLLLDSQERQRGEIEAVATSLAHDIRTPLGRIRQAVDAARHGGDFQLALDRVDTESSRLLAMVTTLLETSRARWGMGRDAFAPNDMAVLVDEIAELYAPVAAEAGMPIRVDIAPDAAGELPVSGNRQLLAQALVNLIENALRHATGSPAIILSVRRQGHHIVAAVADRGPGIAAADRDNVTRAFVRLDPSRSGDGHGLGLSLVSAVAALHDGRLELGDNHPGLVAALWLPAVDG
jgi:signal transduction histidine kinase